MSEVIERAVKAIMERDFAGEGAVIGPMEAEALVRAVLAAIREPTERMESAGDDTFDWTSSDTNGSYYPQTADATECWQAMIDAALVETEK